MKVATLDLGTNTFLLLIAEVSNGRVERVLHDEVRVVRLGQGVHESRSFHPDALQRADECFADYAKTIAQHKVEKVLACATSAARDVANKDELLKLAKKHGIPLEIISGEREAELTFKGTIDETSKGPVCIIDVGGGSTEFIFGVGQTLEARTSVDVGAVRLTELLVTHHPIPSSDLAKLRTYIQDKVAVAMKEFGEKILARQGTRMVAVAGTPTTLATIEQGLAFESERVHGFKLSQERLKYWVEKLSGMTIAERQKLAGMEPKRADVIVAGAMILLLASEAFRSEALEVSIRGLRYGIARALSDGSI
jgi:exopolyphosphatase/guanosine-5'-triphosphate,3'-diphosphate pyrophosphatase